MDRTALLKHVQLLVKLHEECVVQEDGPRDYSWSSDDEPGDPALEGSGESASDASGSGSDSDSADEYNSGSARAQRQQQQQNDDSDEEEEEDI